MPLNTQRSSACKISRPKVASWTAVAAHPRLWLRWSGRAVWWLRCQVGLGQAGVAGVALPLLQPEPARRRDDPGPARDRGQLREHPRLGPALWASLRQRAQASPTTPGDKWHLDEVLILSAKSGGLDKSGEGVTLSWRAATRAAREAPPPYWLLYLCAKRWRPLPSSPACSRKPPQSVLPPLDCDRARHPGNRLYHPAPKPRASVFLHFPARIPTETQLSS